jgi:uncharacterized lipoprotein YddW (UPF0748 family)
MNKRQFIQSLAWAAAGLASAKRTAIAGTAVPQAMRQTRNWVWLTLEREQSAEDWRRDFARMRASGVDAVLAEVYDGQRAYWASARLPVGSTRLETLLALAHREGLEFHAWMWCMPCRVPAVMREHPDWYNVNARGESALDKPAYVDYYRFLDPAHPGVREFLKGIVTELAGIDGMAGVHLDYVRHPDAILPKGLWAKYGLVQDRVFPEYDYGYTAYSRDLFKKQQGVDPLALASAEQEHEWLRYRLNSVTALVNEYLVPAAHGANKQITAAVFPGPTLARQMVRQDWGHWKLDAFMPMLYHNFYEAGAEWVREQTREGVATVKQPIYSGLFAPAVVAPGLTRIVEGALQGGAAGVSIFHAQAMDDSLWKAFAAAVRAN